MVKKFVFFLAWLGILILSILGIVYTFASDRIITQYGYFLGIIKQLPIVNRFDVIDTNLISKCLIFIISVWYMFLCFLKVYVGFKKDPDYQIKTDDGIVTVSPQIVNNYVKDYLKSDDEIRNLKVDTQKNGKRFDIKIKTDIMTNGNVADKSSYIQNEIKNKISEKIGIDIGKVEVKISKLSRKTENENQPTYYKPLEAPTSYGRPVEAAPVEEYHDIKENHDEQSNNNAEKKSFFGSIFNKKKDESTSEKTADESNTSTSEDTSKDTSEDTSEENK